MITKLFLLKSKYMFKKIFFWLITVFIISNSSFLITHAQECNYGEGFMQCGKGGCPSSQRCVFDSKLTNLDGSVTYKGICKDFTDIPCAVPANYNAAANLCTCGDNNPDDNVLYKCVSLALYQSLPSAGSCNSDGLNYQCENYGVMNPYSKPTDIYACLGYVYNPPTDCGTSLNTWNTYNYTKKGCFDKPSKSCSLPQSSPSENICVSQSTSGSWCSVGEVCAKTYRSFLGVSFNGSYCGPGTTNDINNGTGMSCCSEYTSFNNIKANYTCGKKIPISGFSGSYGYYDCCDSAYSCVGTNVNESGQPVGDPVTGKGSSMPDTGKCKKCVANYATDPSGKTCTDTTSGKGLDDCCNKDYQCMNVGGANKCVKAFTPQMCTSGSESYIKQGTMCAPKDLIGVPEYDLCDQKCPVKDDTGKKWYDVGGNRYCLSWTSTKTCMTGSGTCGCTTGKTCSDGACVDASTCVANEATCTTGASSPKCCGDPKYTCSTDPLGGTSPPLYRCMDTECAAIKAGTADCTARASCCPSGGMCDPTTKRCIDNRDCSKGDGTCCAVGLSCQAGSCSKEDDKCNYVPTEPSEAAKYTGPPITLEGLFSSIINILFPLAIGFGLFYTVYWGYQMMTSQGNPDRVKAAQEGLTSAVIGLVFVILASSILKLIINTLLG